MALQRPDQPAGPIARRFGAVTLVVALVVGMQLGSIPWRFRRQILQLQGFLLGALVGYVVGRLKEPSGSRNLPPAP